jgi:hypothetical protein
MEDTVMPIPEYKTSRRKELKKMIVNYLADGPKPSKPFILHILKLRHCKRTFDYARKELEIIVYKDSMNGQFGSVWMMKLPHSREYYNKFLWMKPPKGSIEEVISRFPVLEIPEGDL